MLRSLIAVLLALAALAGCGRERTPVPETGGPGQRLGDNPLSNPAAGYRLIAPAGWVVAAGEPPLVSTISSGPVIVSIFRFARSEPLPKAKDQLDHAITDLIAAAKARNPSFEAIRSARVRVDGRAAIQVRGTQTISGHQRAVRSTHVFAFGGELVIDMLAPVDGFKTVDSVYFRPLLRSLRLSAPKP